MEHTLQLGGILKDGMCPVESEGGDNWRILHGDTLKLVKAFQPGTFDAVITDPPYASGGTKQNERNRTTNQKYSSMSPEKALPDFDGDQKDQRSWTHWMAEWLYDVRKACKSGAPICLFIDWRQYPSMTDALQWAGWIWRGTAVWDKTNSRPQKGRFRQQTEFIIWGSNGPMPISRPVSCLPGVFRYGNPQNRVHVTEKPFTCPERGAGERKASTVDERCGTDLRAGRKNPRSFCRSRYYNPCGCPAGIPGSGH